MTGVVAMMRSASSRWFCPSPGRGRHSNGANTNTNTFPLGIFTRSVIYVARNPKDVAVSFYHFHHLAKFLPDPGSFDTFLTQFLEGTAQRLAAFLGCPLGPETLGALEQHCSFAAMRDNTMANYTLIPSEIMDHSQGRFMRKGVVGDWRDHFSPQQNSTFNRRYQEEMGDVELPTRWPMA
ncbi:PREDICTED: sulfotransferase family cytosolic 2B member 1-like [Chaetura pelagica]|uniref:sulfotransferase family cytosolic 2B member 1-like n=1 Tax=Chaetura pelagica TaxID=8897 RepID=UPI000523B0D5|nr:PREDICTED: sulfotransferase family cytosolic 2B member 1-like [Chaetura pelagica]